MGRTIILILLSMVLSIPGWSQTQERWKQADEESYALYLASDWDQLIVVAEQAVQEGIDSYYMRIRLGMAYYYLGRYEKARKQFILARNFQQQDPVSTEYLYFANLYGGRYLEARKLLPELPMVRRKEIHAQAEYSLQALIMEGGWMGNAEAMQLIEAMPREQVTSSYLMRDVLYANVGLALNLGYSSTGLVAVNPYNINSLQGLFVNDSLYSLNQTGTQNGFYLNYTYQFDNSWHGGFAFHGLQGDYQVSAFQQTENDSVAGISRSIESYSQRYIGFFAGKHVANFNLSGNVSKNTFWDGTWTQAGVKLFWYPWGSSDFYLGLGYDRMKAQDLDSPVERVFKLTGGFTLLNYLQFEASHITGDLGNWADLNGYYIFNTVYPVLSRSSATLTVNGLSPYFKINFTAVLQNRSHEAGIYFEDGTVEPFPQQYRNTSFFGGFIWIL